MDKSAFAHEMMLRYRDEIVQVVQDLVRLPSRNTPPTGEEKACQVYIGDYLQGVGLSADLYEPDQVPGLLDHPAYWPGRTYKDRPNVASILAGRGGGRSLLLTGHVDTVPLGEGAWSKPPFGAEVHDGRLYGRGSIDMKGPLGAMLVLYKALAEQQIPLRGTLSFESVVDEEVGGVNATIAGRLRYGPMEGAVLAEASQLQIYPATRGILATDFIFTSAEGTWLDVGSSLDKSADAVRQMGIFLTHLDELRAVRRSQPVPPLYRGYADPAPVEVTKVYAGGWGNQVPMAVPTAGYIELIVQVLPGEDQATVARQQKEWLESVIERNQASFATRPQTHQRIRWLAPTAIDPAHPLVTTLADSVAQVTGQRPAILGAPFACDMFALHQFFQTPCVVFGPIGANAHAPDEYVDLESLFTFWESLLQFVLAWCGWEE